MAVTLVNPEGLPETGAYHHVSVATGSKLVFVAGQVAWDADGNTGGEGDLAAQGRNRPQQRLFALDAPGEGGGLKALRVDGYAPRRLGPPRVIQGALSPYHEGWG